MEKVLVTGGEGFIGSHVVDELRYRGYEAIIYDTFSNPHQDVRNVRTLKQYMEGVSFVLHLAANPYIPHGYTHPNEFFDINATGTLNVLEAARENDVRVVYTSCHDDKTRCFTQEGLKEYKDIKESDLVLSLNPETYEIEWKTINKILKYEYKGEMIEYFGKRYSLCVTPNHKMMLRRTNGEIFFETAEETQNRTLLRIPEGNYVSDKTIKEIDINGNKYDAEILFYLTGLYIGDGHASITKKKVKNKSGLKRDDYLKIRDEKGRFKIANEDERGDEACSVCTGHRVFFDLPRTDKNHKKVLETLKKIGLTPKSYEKTIYVSSKDLLEFFDKCGHTAYEKHIPKWMLEYDKKLLMKLYEGLMDSDGHGNVQYTTVSEKLLSDIIELTYKIERNITFKKYKQTSYIEGRKISGKSYQIHFSDTDRTLITRKNTKKVNYDGVVWCLNINDNHNFLVERNGKLTFSGNSSEVYGTAQDPYKSMDENHRIHPHSTYALAKYAGDGLCYTYYKEHNLDVTVVRMFNNFGPRETWRYVVPEIIEQLHKSDTLHLGNIYAERDFTYVEDGARALVDVMECGGLEGEVLNCGSGSTHSIQSIAFTLGEVIRPGGDIKIKVDDWRLRPHDVDRLLCDNSKIRRLTGWTPETDFYEGLINTVRWFRGNGEKWNYREVYK